MPLDPAQPGVAAILAMCDPTGAASAAQTYAVQRSNQTGTQIASTISDLGTAVVAAAIWSTIPGRPSFATVATTGAYSDLTGAPAAVTWSTLSGKPTFATVATTGAYSDLSGLPTLGTQMSVDSGWGTNGTSGDKTIALASYSNGLNSTMISALNVVSGGTGTALSAGFDMLVNVVKQLAAIKTVLVASKLPNQ